MARVNRQIATGLIAALALGAAAAQEDPAHEDPLTLPPRIEGEPGDARLEPPPEEREEMLEAVVTGGQTDWRLPDLGTSMREEEDALDPDQRIDLGFVPLYDPEARDPSADLAPEVEVLRGVGFIKLVEFRFGRRTPGDNDE